MHELDPLLFDPASIPAETHRINAAIAELTKDLANWWDVGAPRVREARARGEGPFPALQMSARARAIEIPGPAGTPGTRAIRLRVIAPERPRGVYLHLHGGGWVLGACDQQDRLLERIADGTRLTAVSVEYRLAPEHPYPAGPDDCEVAATWVLEHAAELGGDTLAIGGRVCRRAPLCAHLAPRTRPSRRHAISRGEPRLRCIRPRAHAERQVFR